MKEQYSRHKIYYKYKKPFWNFFLLFVLEHRMLLISVIFRVVGGENVCIILNIVYLHMLQLHPTALLYNRRK